MTCIGHVAGYDVIIPHTSIQHMGIDLGATPAKASAVTPGLWPWCMPPGNGQGVQGFIAPIKGSIGLNNPIYEPFVLSS